MLKKSTYINYVEYGENNSKIILMLHGGGMSWWNFKSIAEKLQDDYRVILPVLDGHSGSQLEYKSIEKNTDRLIKFIQQHFDEPIFLMCGFSLGAQTLVEMLSQKNDLCCNAIIESALVRPMPISDKLNSVLTPFVYPLIKKKWFSAYQFKSLRLPYYLFDDFYKDSSAITKTSLSNIVHANATYVLKSSFSKVKANTIIIAGEKEINNIIISANLLHSAPNNSTLIIERGLYHGEFCMKRVDNYLKLIYKL